MFPSKATTYHRSLTDALTQAQSHSLTRRGALRTSLVAGGVAMASFAAPAALGFRSAMAQDFEGPIDVLNYALTLEHLESKFYRQYNAEFSGADIEAAGFGSLVVNRLTSIEAHEIAHVDALIATIEGLGGTPVGELMYSFGVTDVVSYIATAQVLENLGTGAYTGAAQFLIDNDDLLTAALTIHGIEARHASYLNLINGDIPFPDAFEPAIAPADVLAAATPLIVSGMPSTGTGPASTGDSAQIGALAAAGAVGLGAAAIVVRNRTAKTASESASLSGM